MMSPAAKQLTTKLQTKGKHRPHKMVKKKLPDGSGAIAVLPRRGSGRDAGALDDEYCAAVESCAAVFSRNKEFLDGSFGVCESLACIGRCNTRNPGVKCDNT